LGQLLRASVTEICCTRLTYSRLSFIVIGCIRASEFLEQEKRRKGSACDMSQESEFSLERERRVTPEES